LKKTKMQLDERNDSPRKVAYHLRSSTVKQCTDFHKWRMNVLCEYIPDGLVSTITAWLN